VLIILLSTGRRLVSQVAYKECFSQVSSNAAFEDTFLFLDIADFVSQVLLCFILWDIGTKEVSEEVSDIRSRVETASFDEDAEL
jgi:hypothetical protein